mmetsp:Transcript_1792/g.2540  ORF Transcript_1792/g.2540 Transcript_1792/m.2540 type:complete len:209 (-) Transcript_1792:867-1493(-)
MQITMQVNILKHGLAWRGSCPYSLGGCRGLRLGGLRRLSWLLLDGLFFGADDAPDVVANALIADALSLEEVLGDHFGDFFLRVGRKVILFDVELHDTVVGEQAALEGGRVALVDLVGGDVEAPNRLVVAQVLRQALAEHIAEEIRGQVQIFQLRFLHSQVDAHLLAGLVVNAVQFQIQRDQRLVHLEGLAQVARAFVVNAVIAQVQMG